MISLSPNTMFAQQPCPPHHHPRATPTRSPVALPSFYPPRVISASGYPYRPNIPVIYAANAASVSPGTMFAQYQTAHGQAPPCPDTLPTPQAVIGYKVSDYVNPADADVSGRAYLGPIGNGHHAMHSSMDAPPANSFAPGHDSAPSLVEFPHFHVNAASALVNQVGIEHGPIPGWTANTMHQTFSTSHVEPPTVVTPTFRCEIPNCGVDVTVDKRQILIHLLMAHDHPVSSRGQSVSCLWPGCICRKQGTDGLQCKGRTSGHVSHAEDIVDHIWETHLGFQDICPKCGDARWAYTFSMGRHEKTCEGRQPVRCRQCLVMFPSRVAFTGHIELRQCTGFPPSAVE
jgi:hypothetical protein